MKPPFATAPVSPRGSPAQSWLPKSGTTERKYCLACRTSIGDSSSLNSWGREADRSLWSRQRWEGPQPSSQDVSHEPQDYGALYSSSPSLGSAIMGGMWGQECEEGGKSRWDRLVQASDLSSYPEDGDRNKKTSYSMVAVTGEASVHRALQLRAIK